MKISYFSNCVLTIICLGPAAIFPSCSKTSAAPAPPPLPPVVIAVAMEKTVPVELQAFGRAQVKSTVSILSQVAGRIEETHITEGQDVKRGDVLFTMDPTPFDAALKVASADLNKDRVKLKQAEGDLARYQLAAKSGAATTESVDHARWAVDAANAAIAWDEANIKSAQVNRDWCTIRSPIDGRAGALQAFPGAVVKANEGPPFVILNQIRPIDVAFSIADQWLPEIRRRAAGASLAVAAVIPEDREHPVSGVLGFLDNSVDVPTGTIKLKATFINDDLRLWPGQFVEIKLKLNDETQVVVPAEAVQPSQKGYFVFVVREDSTVEARPVSAGRSVDGETIIINGLKAGERVVRDGLQRLTSGMKVETRS